MLHLRQLNHFSGFTGRSLTADQLLVVKAYDGNSAKLICELPIRHEGLLSKPLKQRAMDFMRSIDVE